MEGQAVRPDALLPVLARTQALLRGLGRIDEAGQLVPDASRPVAISVGMAVLSEQAQMSADLIQAADQALDRAKKGSRNQVVMATADTVSDRG